MGRITIKDVAREAGVSISTVSNALNNVDVLHPRTKERILEVAERLQYTPNLSGRNLRSKSTKVLGLFVTSIKGDYYGTLADDMHHECEKRGYELNIFISKNSNDIMANILGKRIDGALILNEHIGDEQVATMLKGHIPVVFLDREVCAEKMSSLVFDAYLHGQAAGRYLLSLGHRTFGYLRGPAENYDNQERLRGYTDTLKAAGLFLSPEYIFTGLFDRQAAFQATIELLEAGRRLPEAIFAANDLSAIGFIEALRHFHVSVPEEISVMGCDNIDVSQWFLPRLTTIDTSYTTQGSIAVAGLVGMINGKQGGSVRKLAGKVIIRESCREAARGL